MKLLPALFLLFLLFLPALGDEVVKIPPEVAPASEEAALSMKRFQLAEGLEVSLFAAEPHLANPVAFTIPSCER